jgi:hypothetical protein
MCSSDIISCKLWRIAYIRSSLILNDFECAPAVARINGRVLVPQHFNRQAGAVTTALQLLHFGVNERLDLTPEVKDFAPEIDRLLFLCKGGHGLQPAVQAAFAENVSAMAVLRFQVIAYRPTASEHRASR